MPLSADQQRVVDRFVAVCQSDPRVVAALLVGSHASGRADAYSDIDLCLVAADASHEALVTGLDEIVRQVGEPIFLEDFDVSGMAFFVLADGTECELSVVRESELGTAVTGPYEVLAGTMVVDVLAGLAVGPEEVDATEQTEELRRLVQWFWHDLSHFIAAMGRGQLWWGHGQLEELRLMCVNLARLTQDFSAAADGYEKLDQAVDAEALRPLERTVGSLNRAAMLGGAAVLVDYYRERASALTRGHGLEYPEQLDRVVSARLEELRRAAR